MPKRRVKKVSGEVESERLLVTPSMLYVGTPGTWDCRAVNASSFPIDLVMLTQANQHRMVQLPPPSGLPIAQSTPTRHATAEAHGLGQVFPRDACLKHKQNSIESSLITDNALARAYLVGWNKGGNQGL